MSTANVTQFRFKTADKFPGRDPVRWVLEMWRRVDGYNMFSTSLHKQTQDYETPVLRYQWTEWFDVNTSAVPVDRNNDFNDEDTLDGNPFHFGSGNYDQYDRDDY